MPRNSGGVATQPAGTAGVPGTTIQSTPYNNLTADIYNEITNSLPTTGVKSMGANLPMGGFRVANMGDPAIAQDAATKNYVDTATAAAVTYFIGGTTTGTAGAQVLASTAPATFTRTKGFKVGFTPGFTNVTTLTLTVGATLTTNVFKDSQIGPVALTGGEVVATQFTTATFDGAQYVLDTPSGNTSNPQFFTGNGTFELTGTISPTALGSGTTNDYSPTGFATATMLRISGNAAGSALSGLLARNSGTNVTLLNVSANPITLLPNSASSSALNRFIIGAPIVLGANQSVGLWYDNSSGGWRNKEVQMAAPTALSRKNLKIVTTSATAATITADELVLEDTLGNTFRATNVSVSYATGTSGAGGIDTGSVAASNWYHEFTIYNPSTNALTAVISLSPTAPTMPSGYTFKARCGASYYDAGAKLRFKIQYDRRAQIVTGTNPTTPVAMATGNSGNTSTPTWTAVAVGAFVPTTAAVIWGTLNFNQSDNSGAQVAPNNTYGAWNNNTNVFPLGAGNSGITGSNINTRGQFSLILESTNIYYASSNSGAGVFVNGWEDSL